MIGDVRETDIPNHKFDGLTSVLNTFVFYP